MEILTIVRPANDYGVFDADVNKALADGWQLTKREVLPGMQYNADNWARRALYAELVKLDPPEEPETVDVFKALHTVKEACLAHTGPCNDCPIHDWCNSLAYGGDPTDWDLPEVDA